jgi:hypothetical protein
MMRIQGITNLEDIRKILPQKAFYDFLTFMRLNKL